MTRPFDRYRHTEQVPEALANDVREPVYESHHRITKLRGNRS